MIGRVIFMYISGDRISSIRDFKMVSTFGSYDFPRHFPRNPFEPKFVFGLYHNVHSYRKNVHLYVYVYPTFRWSFLKSSYNHPMWRGGQKSEKPSGSENHNLSLLDIFKHIRRRSVGACLFGSFFSVSDCCVGNIGWTKNTLLRWSTDIWLNIR